MKKQVVTIVGMFVLGFAAACSAAPTTEESDDEVVTVEQPLMSGGFSAQCGQWPSCPKTLPDPPAGKTCTLKSESCDGRNQTCNYICTSTRTGSMLTRQ